MIHDLYARLPVREREGVDTAFSMARRGLAAAGFTLNNGDDAERLVEAIAVYVVESDPSVREKLAPPTD